MANDEEPFVELKVLTSRKYTDQPGCIKFLNEDVNELMAKGWELHGGLQVVKTEYGLEYYQPMIFNYFEEVDVPKPAHLGEVMEYGDDDEPERARHL